MSRSHRTLRRLARAAAVVTWLAGGYGVLSMMGAFGPVSCWTGRSVSGSAASNGTETTTTPTVTRGCESGIDALVALLRGGPPGEGNAEVLFSWSLVLLVLVAVGGYAAWTDRRWTTWASALVGVAVTVVGVFSIGWYFLIPALSLLVAGTALTVAARREE